MSFAHKVLLEEKQEKESYCVPLCARKFIRKKVTCHYVHEILLERKLMYAQAQEMLVETLKTNESSLRQEEVKIFSVRDVQNLRKHRASGTKLILRGEVCNTSIF